MPAIVGFAIPYGVSLEIMPNDCIVSPLNHDGLLLEPHMHAHSLLIVVRDNEDRAPSLHGFCSFTFL